MRGLIAWGCAASVLLWVPSLASANETVRYRYDAKGRLVRVERTGTVNNGVNTDYRYDRANNRVRIIVAGSRVQTHLSHQMTIAAMAMVAMKFLTFRSKRVATRRQSLKRQNMRSTTFRWR
jgi:RHS Repeat